MNRRHFLRTASAASLTSLCLTGASFGAPAAQAGKKRKILFFSKSSGFEHSVISYKNGQPSFAEKILSEMGPKNGWEFTFSKDGSLFTPEYLAGFDAFFFYTTGNLCEPGTDKNPPMTPAGKQAFLDAIKSGKGYIGTHSAADTFHTDNESKKGPDRYQNHGAKADPYVRMLGGEFIKHGAQQVAKMRCVDAKFPGFANAAEGFSFQEEWYTLKDFSDDLHVLLVQETEGMKGNDYQRPPYPATWARKHGEGRVFYTSMGHREDVWTNPQFQRLLTGGIEWAVRNVDADITPNFAQVTPKGNELQAYYKEEPKQKNSATPAAAPGVK